MALSIETYGEGSSFYAKSLIVMARYLSETDQRQKADSMWNIALRIVSKEEGERSVAAANIMVLLAHNSYIIQYHSTKDYTVASMLAETAVQVIKEKLGGNNFLIVEPTSSIANLIKEKARATSDEEEKSQLMGKVEKLESECLTILTAMLGEYSPFTTMIMMNLGNTYNESWKNSEAEELLSKSLAIREKILGDCEAVAETHDHLASLYVDMEELDKAEHHYKEAIQIIERVYGPAHYFLGKPVRLKRTTSRRRSTLSGRNSRR